MRRAVLLAALATVLAGTGTGVAVARHVRVDLFDDYHAGYAKGHALIGKDWELGCDLADRAAYPTQYRGPGPTGYPGTDEVVAFMGGCIDGALGHANDPWHGVRAALAGD
jgi:hypothetical protein